MNIIYRNQLAFEHLWGDLVQSDIYQYPLYSKSEISYQKFYFLNYQFTDLSFVIEESNIPILGIIISKRKIENKIYEFSGFGRPVYYVENKAVSNKVLKGARKKFKEIIESYIDTSLSAKLIFMDLLISKKLSFFGDLLLMKGARHYPVFSQVINLKQTETEIHNHLRKSYRSLINWGKNNLNIIILNANTINETDIDKFRALHIKEAGRETRNRDTWIQQLEMVKQNEAFIIFGHLNNSLVTAAFFSHSAKYCYYGVSASVRALFEKPLSHAILYTAIMHAKEIGCSFFEMGEILFPDSGEVPPNSKELGISTFKRGFGGEIDVRLNIKLEFNK